jgi:hypothetical protein
MVVVRMVARVVSAHAGLRAARVVWRCGGGARLRTLVATSGSV